MDTQRKKDALHKKVERHTRKRSLRWVIQSEVHQRIKVPACSHCPVNHSPYDSRETLFSMDSCLCPICWGHVLSPGYDTYCPDSHGFHLLSAKRTRIEHPKVQSPSHSFAESNSLFSIHSCLPRVIGRKMIVHPVTAKKNSEWRSYSSMAHLFICLVKFPFLYPYLFAYHLKDDDCTPSCWISHPSLRKTPITSTFLGSLDSWN